MAIKTLIPTTHVPLSWTASMKRDRATLTPSSTTWKPQQRRSMEAIPVHNIVHLAQGRPQEHLRHLQLPGRHSPHIMRLQRTLALRR